MSQFRTLASTPRGLLLQVTGPVMCKKILNKYLHSYKILVYITAYISLAFYSGQAPHFFIEEIRYTSENYRKKHWSQ